MSKKPARIPSLYAKRIAQVREQMQRHKLDGYLILNRQDQYWLTGFTGEDGGVLLTPRAIVLLTDGRFGETATREAPFAKKIIRKKRGPEATVQEIHRYRLRSVGYDPGHMTVQVFNGLKRLLAPTRLMAAGNLVGAMREIKSPQEVKRIRHAIDVAQRAFRKIEKWARPGLTERRVAAKLIYEMQALGAEGPSFTPIVASGPNASLPHYEPGSRNLRDGEPVLIDWGARVDWYVSDLTRMLWIGSIPRRIRKLYDVVRAAHDGAIDAVRPGVKAADVDKVARNIIRKAGFGKQFTHGLGHGIGLDVHEAPSLGRTAAGELKPGMVVTIEPGIYIPGVCGVRLEDDVLVTKTGCEVLSDLPLDLPR